MLCGVGTLLQKGLLPHAPTPQNSYCVSGDWSGCYYLNRRFWRPRLSGITTSQKLLCSGFSFLWRRNTRKKSSPFQWGASGLLQAYQTGVCPCLLSATLCQGWPEIPATRALPHPFATARGIPPARQRRGQGHSSVWPLRPGGSNIPCTYSENGRIRW